MVNIVLSPIIIAIILGFIIGTRIHSNLENSFKFTISGIITIILGSSIISYNLGQFPTYNDLPIATTFLGAIFGILIGSALVSKTRTEKGFR